MTGPHGWSFVSGNRLVHSGPLHLIRVIYNCKDDQDSLKLYDGLSDTGRQVAHLQGNEEYAETYEFGVRLTTGLYVTTVADCEATIVFDPLGDE